MNLVKGTYNNLISVTITSRGEVMDSQKYEYKQKTCRL